VSNASASSSNVSGNASNFINSLTLANGTGLVSNYSLQGLDIWHFDFYRFNDPREWEDAGFRDIFSSVGLKICEWPDKAQGVLPGADLDIHFSVNTDSSRDVRLCAHSELGEDLTA
jgi:tRNA threonylcarbamoyladenosine biosynthesis protein TsaE